MKRLLAGLMTTVLCLGLLTGCGSKEFDAAKYTQGCLDALLKAEFSEDYLEFSGNDKEDAQKAYESSIDKDLEEFLSEDEGSSSDALKQKYRDMFKKVYKNTKYEVTNSKKNENGTYTVTVKAYRLIVFANTIQPVLDYYNDLSDKEQEKITQEQIDGMVVDNAVKNLEKIKYADETTDIDITVAPLDGSPSLYGIATEDYQVIYDALMDGSEWAAEADEEPEADSKDGSNDIQITE